MDTSAEVLRLAASTPLAMFEWRLAHDPEAPLIVTPDGVARTYADLGRRAALLASVLDEAGVRRGDVVGLYLGNEPVWVVALLACWRIGAVAACCASMSPVTEASRRFALAKAVAVISTREFEGVTDTIGVDPEGEPIKTVEANVNEPVAPCAGTFHPEDPAAILFTSGTTGEPKAVWRQNADLAAGPRMTAGAYARSAEFRPRTASNDAAPAPSFSPFGHASALGRFVFRMYVGRQLLLIPKFDLDSMEQVASRYAVDSLHLTPAMIHELALTDRAIRFKALKYVNSGSAPLPVATRDRFEARYGVPVLQAYGATEGAITALERYDDVIAGRRGPGSVGRIPAGMPHRIVDPAGKEVRPGEEGELLGKLSGQAGGMPHLAVDANGWFHTGDLARIDEHGILYITGRIKEMMIVGGFNVYPGEVEGVLLEASQIRDIVVVSIPDGRLGELPVAGVVWQPGVPAENHGEHWTRIVLEARKKLEPYKLPREWFSMAGVPLNANGKVDRAAAAALAQQVLCGT